MSTKFDEIWKELNVIYNSLQHIAKENPFYAYNPTVGAIGAEERKLLSKYFSDAEIPESIDGAVDYHRSTAPLTAVCGGNQSSKSCSSTIDTICKVSHLVPPSMRDWYPKEKFKEQGLENVFRVVCVDDKQFLNTVLPAWKKWTPRTLLKNGSFDSSYTTRGKEGQKVLRLYHPSYSDELIATIEFMTNKMEVESFQGPPRVGVLYDEQPKKVIHDENMVRMSTNKVDVTFAFTPTKGITWATDLFGNDKLLTGVRERYHLTPLNNPAANVDTLKIIWDTLYDEGDIDQLKMRIFGYFVSLFGVVYQGIFKKNVHVIEPFEITHDDYVIYRGLDPHATTPTYAVEVAVDRDENQFVIGTVKWKYDMEKFKEHMYRRAKDGKYRLGWSVCDVSADSEHKLFGKNMFKELRTGDYGIEGLYTSGKSTGSIHAGVETIKTLLRGEVLPKLYIFNTEGNKELIKSMMTLERAKGINEEVKGPKDVIEEGRHHAHACLRYLNQKNPSWYPVDNMKPKPRRRSYI